MANFFSSKGFKQFLGDALPIATGGILGASAGGVGGQGIGASIGSLAGAGIGSLLSPSANKGSSSQKARAGNVNSGGSFSGGGSSAPSEPAPPPPPTLAEQIQTILGITKESAPQFQELVAGLGEQFLPRQLDLFNQLRDTDLGNILSSAEGFQPRLDALQRATEGDALSEIRDLTSQQVLEELRAGQSLSEAQQRNVEQGTRAGEVARGIGSGGGGANREAVQRSLEGFNLFKERLGLGQAVRGFEQSQRRDPVDFVTTTPTNIPFAQNAFNTGLDLTANAVGQGTQLNSLQQQLANSRNQFSGNLALQQAQFDQNRFNQDRAFNLESSRR